MLKVIHRKKWSKTVNDANGGMIEKFRTEPIFDTENAAARS